MCHRRILPDACGLWRFPSPRATPCRRRITGSRTIDASNQSCDHSHIMSTKKSLITALSEPEVLESYQIFADLYKMDILKTEEWADLSLHSGGVSTAKDELISLFRSTHIHRGSLEAHKSVERVLRGLNVEECPDLSDDEKQLVQGALQVILDYFARRIREIESSEKVERRIEEIINKTAEQG